MEITIKVDGGQAQVSGPGQQAQADAPTAGPSEAPPDVLARAAATGAIAAGPAPSQPSGPGASSQLAPPTQPTAPGVSASGTDVAAGAAPGAVDDRIVELPVADDDTEEEGD